jgi:ubiquinone/menaquinone biosynthesis C-methylase UbiE
MSTTKAYNRNQAETYDRHHFGGRSGQYILHKDCRAVQSLLEPPPGLILDIPCGSGTYTAALITQGYQVVAADASLPMLEVAGQQDGSTLRVLCDISHLPFRDGTFDAIVTLRLFSHFAPPELARMLHELRRAIRPVGRVIFDTFRWTPRRWPILRLLMEQSYINVIANRDVEEMIRSAGLIRVEVRHLYLFSPIWERKVPLWALQVLDVVERLLPQSWLLRTFWACTKD